MVPRLPTRSAKLQLRSGRFEEAESWVRRALQISPRYSGGQFDLGLTLLMRRTRHLPDRSSRRVANLPADTHQTLERQNRIAWDLACPVSPVSQKRMARPVNNAFAGAGAGFRDRRRLPQLISSPDIESWHGPGVLDKGAFAILADFELHLDALQLDILLG